jgi:D-ribose pyranose/furanose isomerase RbsD
MAAYNKINQFVEDIAKAVHNLSTGALTLALTANANKPVATNTVLANLTQIAYTNLSSRVVAISSAVQTSGTFKLMTGATNTVLTASGAVAPFANVCLYNDTPTSPADPLIAWWEYGSDVTLANTETFTVDWDDTNGILQIA